MRDWSRRRRVGAWLEFLALLTGFAAVRADAQTDEIQVYNAEIAAPGIFNLTLHDNYTPSGRKGRDFRAASCRIMR